MPARPSKKRPQGPSDPNSIAFRVLGEVTGQASTEPDTRNQAAVALGKLGASKGGKARAKALTPKKRKEIAKKAARKRWGGQKST
jgi:hypothetical protein